MTNENFSDEEHQANDVTHPDERAKLKYTKLQATYAEKMQEALQDAEPGQNYGVFGILSGLPINTNK